MRQHLCRRSTGAEDKSGVGDRNDRLVRHKRSLLPEQFSLAPPVSRTARYSFMGTRGLRPRGVTVYFRTNLVGTLGAKALEEPPPPYRLRASPRLNTNVVGTCRYPGHDRAGSRRPVCAGTPNRRARARLSRSVRRGAAPRRARRQVRPLSPRAPFPRLPSRRPRCPYRRADDHRRRRFSSLRASSCPCSAASRNHRAASGRSRRTPRPSLYNNPSIY